MASLSTVSGTVRTALLLGVAVGASVSVALVGARAFGAEAAAAPTVVAYDGVLDWDGAGYSGSVDLTFALYDGDPDGSGVSLGWSETHTAAVHAGEFRVYLGSTSDASAAALLAAISASPDLRVRVSATQGGVTTVLGTQRFAPVPAALWTTASTNFDVAVDVTVSGKTTAAALDVDGDLTLSGDVSVAGTIALPYSTVTCTSKNDCACPSGTVVIGGFVSCSGSLQTSYPNSATNWRGECETSNWTPQKITVTCLDIQ